MDTSTPGTILVPLDGSRLDEAALPVVQRLALATGARAVLLRVVRERGPTECGEREAAEQSVVRAADRLRAAGVTTVAEACAGVRLACVLRQATLWRAGLIVMADAARGPLARLLLGGGAGDALLRVAPVPVLLVPAHRTMPRARGGTVVLAVVDESPEDASTLEHAGRLARALSLGVVLLRVVSPPPPVVATDCLPMPPPTDELLPEASAYVRGLALDLRRGSGLPASGEALVGPTAGTIVARAEAWDAAAIVLGPRGWSERLFPRLGSLPGGVLARTPRPVLCAPPPALAGGLEAAAGGALGAPAAAV